MVTAGAPGGNRPSRSDSRLRRWREAVQGCRPMYPRRQTCGRWCSPLIESSAPFTLGSSPRPVAPRKPASTSGAWGDNGDVGLIRPTWPSSCGRQGCAIRGPRCRSRPAWAPHNSWIRRASASARQVASLRQRVGGLELGQSRAGRRRSRAGWSGWADGMAVGVSSAPLADRRPGSTKARPGGDAEAEHLPADLAQPGRRWRRASALSAAQHHQQLRRGDARHGLVPQARNGCCSICVMALCRR